MIFMMYGKCASRLLTVDPDSRLLTVDPDVFALQASKNLGDLARSLLREVDKKTMADRHA